MSGSYPGTASSPVKLVIPTYSHGIQSNWPMNESGSDYQLYFNKNFGPIPRNGDPLGLVTAVVGLARRKDSGVTAIRVSSHSLTVGLSDATEANTVQLLLSAVRIAGLGNPRVKDAGGNYR